MWCGFCKKGQSRGLSCGFAGGLPEPGAGRGGASAEGLLHIWEYSRQFFFIQLESPIL